MKSIWVVGALAAAVVLAACGSSKPGAISAPASALVYLRNGDAVISHLRGGDPRELGPAQQALLAPDGTEVIASEDSGGRVTVTLYELRRRRIRARAIAVLAPPSYSTHRFKLLGWSPESRYVVLSGTQATAAGDEGALLVLDTTNGRLERLARGTLLGASFAPRLPDRVVYAAASIVQLDDNESSLWEARIDGTDRERLTNGGLASWPLWTAGGIYFTRLVRLGTRTDPPIYGLARIDPGKRGTIEPIPGISASTPAGPLAASASGRRLVANLESSDGGAVEVWTAQLSHAGWRTTQLNLAGVADGVSSDGSLILASVFGAQPLLESIRWAGNHARVLATAAQAGDWTP